MSRARLNLLGRKFGRLAVVGDKGHDKNGKSIWLCMCECGERIIAVGAVLNRGEYKSCGCLRKYNSTKHGHCYDPIYNSWNNMKQRCYNPNHLNYADYGGRGIMVCSRWLGSFSNFLKDMGERPKGVSLCRKNNDKDYEPSNCYWSIYRKQDKDRRSPCKR